MEPRWTIYCHIHSETGRRYIGLTKLTMMKRWNQHVRNARYKPGKGCHHFWNAIRKYGKEAFSHEVLEVCHTLEVANLAEECWIELFETMDPAKGFNLSRGGKARAPYPPWKDLTFREACGNHANKGKQLSAAHRSKIGVASRSRSRELVEQIASKLRGRPLTEVHRQKIGSKSRGRVHTPETLAKISTACKGRAPIASAIANSITFRKKRAAGRTHFDCRVHGPMLLSECYRRENGRPECRVCRRSAGLRRRRGLGRTREDSGGQPA